MSYEQIVKLALQYNLSKEEAEEFGLSMVFMGNPPEEVVISALRQRVLKQNKDT